MAFFSLRKARGYFLKIKRALLCLLQILGIRAPSAPPVPTSMILGFHALSIFYAICFSSIRVDIHEPVMFVVLPQGAKSQTSALSLKPRYQLFINFIFGGKISAVMWWCGGR